MTCKIKTKCPDTTLWDKKKIPPKIPLSQICVGHILLGMVLALKVGFLCWNLEETNFLLASELDPPEALTGLSPSEDITLPLFVLIEMYILVWFTFEILSPLKWKMANGEHREV